MLKIQGEAVASVQQLREYIKKVNKNVPQSVLDMIEYYIEEGKAEGIRGDIAFAQSCLETGNFTFKDSAVTLEQNNFAGLGVTQQGMRGNAFSDAKTGIRAQIQHLKAYANKESLNNTCVDVRFSYVTRGTAPYVEWLGIQENPNGGGWASGKNYGNKIIDILNQIIYVFLTIFLYLLKCPQSLILSALRAFCFCGKPHISRSIFLYFRYQAWLKSW
ncbi:glucosaminidase domain-containing protein [Blautia stercoris]|uniref:glucosaminidase domain-containing protein n=1 Tax=Blautia stercoris TaxID=871664 RepID=UPI00355B1156